MNETLRQVLAELPEIRKAYRFYSTVIKLCDALQSAANEIERLEMELVAAQSLYSRRQLEEENQRLHAEIERLKNPELTGYAFAFNRTPSLKELEQRKGGDKQG